MRILAWLPRLACPSEKPSLSTHNLHVTCAPQDGAGGVWVGITKQFPFQEQGSQVPGTQTPNRVLALPPNESLGFLPWEMGPSLAH